MLGEGEPMRKFSKWGVTCLVSSLWICGLMASNMPRASAQAGLTELVPSGPTMPPVAPGPSAWGAGVQLAADFLGWLSDQGLKSSINAKLDSMKKQIDAAMPLTGGVLVVIGIQQSEQPDVNGNYARSVLDGYIGGTGATPKVTLDSYLGQSRMEQGVPSGFVRRNLYFWRASSVQVPSQ